ncbi:hypothetical protein NPIL_105031 [Nephila pilipes]|uniref:Uncharacterized protein n=1 Tax=Nephila pilipes TaxID=299642 RepID=A0A8X6TAU2_NEPPI|nr:hypothetical protein NPIL_105031 [Nephila pilipes]
MHECEYPEALLTAKAADAYIYLRPTRESDVQGASPTVVCRKPGTEGEGRGAQGKIALRKPEDFGFAADHVTGYGEIKSKGFLQKKNFSYSRIR